jgi:hypothetical protein
MVFSGLSEEAAMVEEAEDSVEGNGEGSLRFAFAEGASDTEASGWTGLSSGNEAVTVESLGAAVFEATSDVAE